MQENIQLACTDCKRRNYATTKNKKNVTGRLEIKRFCPWCRGHKMHKEVK